ncbi:flagellar hook-basal body complex protein [Psychrobacillus sp. FSL K6-2684]|uniref:flagellar hook-basal body complex protein n=1 Tax=unclassified Psychrobacillus TaxID=2636677 RepID=UPI00124510EA|nr:flagellar hook-basal body complex protein [Psychrobacillus sp. AK 1817]QEY20168.1 flagellar hook-basal body complex protein [Psychrobacillus sp. AK 1817]
MIRSMYSGISGLKNFQTKLDVIGNNISNVNTYGFKKGRTIFKDLISQTTAGASAATGTRGGVNPKQVGLGSQLSAIDTIHSGGSMQSTGNTLDLAISGDGFFQVADSTNANRGGFVNPLYTRAGNFYMDNEGYLVNSDGKFLVGGVTKVDPKALADATKLANDAKKPAEDAAIDAKAKADTLAKALEPLEKNVADAKKSLADEKAKSPADPALIKAAEDKLVAEEKVLKDAQDPTISTTPAGSAAKDAFEANNKAVLAAETLAAANAAVINLSYPDASSVERNWEASGNLNTGGSYLPDTPLTVGGEYRPIKIPTDAQSMNIGQDGTVTFVDKEGTLRWAGQLVLAKFPNAGGLEKVGANYFKDTSNSGEPILQTATQSGMGTVNSGFLEMSNVDLSEEFTDMIVAQRGFQANTRIITTSDQILEELVNLKR